MKRTHGGKRANAGRPKGTLRGRAPRSVIACSPESVFRLAAWANQHDVTMRAAADTAIAHLTQDPE